MTEAAQLTPTEFYRRWGDDPVDADVVLLDVREPAEVAMASVSGALHIPMREIPARMGELNPSVPVVVMCHSGVRSRHVAEFLAASGFERIFNLAGGIDAWSREVDARVPRY